MAPSAVQKRSLLTLALFFLLKAQGERAGFSAAIQRTAVLGLASQQRRPLRKRSGRGPSLNGRAVIDRAEGGWRSSTLSGYIGTGSNATYKKNFRVTKQTFGKLLAQLNAGGFCKDNVNNNPAKQQTGQFKLGVCLYFFAQGTGWKGAADCASLGESTVMKYVDEFMDGTCNVLRPIYMPGTPPSPASVQAVRSEFAARRGVPNVAMATDGTHIPFRPDAKATAIDYKNYKGWTSILAVAFVTSYFTFVDAHVGSAGRCGDNTVLADSWFLKQVVADREAWLGPNGVIAADGGASDGSSLLLNPYRSPVEPDEKYYNFCHSSTRFFVEETFGRCRCGLAYQAPPHPSHHHHHCVPTGGRTGFGFF